MLLNTNIIEEFLKGKNIALTGSEIARKKKLNQKTVSNFLNKLERQGLLKSKKQGKNKLYYLNYYNKETLKQFILSIESLRTIKFLEKNPLIKEIITSINPYIKGSAIIFGSYAKNLQKKHSDLDILIIGRANERKIDQISEVYKLEINPKIYPKTKKKDTLLEEVIKNHIIVKNSEKFITNFLM